MLNLSMPFPQRWRGGHHAVCTDQSRLHCPCPIVLAWKVATETLVLSQWQEPVRAVHPGSRGHCVLSSDKGAKGPAGWWLCSFWNQAQSSVTREIRHHQLLGAWAVDITDRKGLKAHST